MGQADPARPGARVALHGPAIFQAEFEKIWYRTWVYVGHSSEIPKANDFVMKSIGPQPIIMTRDRDGEIHLLHNRCPHRGNRVCVSEQGNARPFTARTTAGPSPTTARFAVTRSRPDTRASTAMSSAWGVCRASLRIAGFVFGSFAAEGPTLEEHLGAATDSIDRLLPTSPEGEVEITAGFLKHKVKSNWKFLVENETDGYHPSFVHASIFEVAQSGIGSLYSGDSTAVARYFGNGHTENDLRPEFRRIGKPLGWFGTTAERLPDYVSRMQAAYGPEKANEIMINGTPHVMIFPNLFIAEIQLFVLQPLAANETVQHVTALQFKGASDLNRRMRQQTMGSVGPAGFLLADDAEMYERTQLGVQAQQPRVALPRARQAPRTPDDNGYLIGDATDETPSRGIWRHYRSLMEAA